MLDIRVGNGYDVHSFIEHETNEHFIKLCGINIPYKKRLNGHSDSDVALHALTDALLGTHNFGDIGTYFPPNEAEWKNANSKIFLLKAKELITKHNGVINNVDITLIAEAPKILPYRDLMCNFLSKTLKLDLNRVSIKATTNEKLGFIGRCEGISAIATACVIYS